MPDPPVPPIDTEAATTAPLADPEMAPAIENPPLPPPPPIDCALIPSEFAPCVEITPELVTSTAPAKPPVPPDPPTDTAPDPATPPDAPDRPPAIENPPLPPPPPIDCALMPTEFAL